MRCTTQVSYAERIARVARYIAEHLDDRLSLDDLSSVAALSPFHFHRIYRAAQGETAAQTVRRLRLERAAAELDTAGQHAAPQLEAVARRAGYASQAAFTRAFSAAFGVPPSAYRADQHAALTIPSPTAMETVMYDVTLEHFSGAHLAVVAHQGSYQAIGSAFERLMMWAGPRGLLGPNTRMFGVYFDDPESVAEADLRSLAGITVPKGTAIAGAAQPFEIPACDIATVLHKGPYLKLSEAYRHLYAQWLPQSGRVPADQPAFEEYLNTPQDVPPNELLTKVALPINV